MDTKFEDLDFINQLVTIFNGLVRVETRGDSTDVIAECKQMLRMMIEKQQKESVND